MSHLLNEERVSVSEFARKLGVSPSTVWRWSRRGVRGVVLETFVVGGRRFTTVEAGERFILGTSKASGVPMVALCAAPVAAQARKTLRQREREIQAAEEELRRWGI